MLCHHIFKKSIILLYVKHFNNTKTYTKITISVSNAPHSKLETFQLQPGNSHSSWFLVQSKFQLYRKQLF